MIDPRIELSLSKISSAELKHSGNFSSQFKDSLKLFEEAYELFLDSVNESRYQHDHDKDVKFNKVFMEMCMKINSDARVIYSAVNLGWYGTANAISRELSDALDKIMFISIYPDEADKIETGKIGQKEVRVRLKSANVASPLSKKAWGRISQSKHAEGGSLSLYGQHVENGWNIKFDSVYDGYMIDGLLTYTLALLIQVALTFREFFGNKYGEVFATPDFAIRAEILGKTMRDKLLRSKGE